MTAVVVIASWYGDSPAEAGGPIGCGTGRLNASATGVAARGRDLRRGDVLVEARPGGRVTRELVLENGGVVAWLDDGSESDGRRVAVCCDAAGVLVADEPRVEERAAS